MDDISFKKVGGCEMSNQRVDMEEVSAFYQEMSRDTASVTAALQVN